MGYALKKPAPDPVMSQEAVQEAARPEPGPDEASAATSPEPAPQAPPPAAEPEIWPGRFMFVAVSDAGLDATAGEMLAKVRPSAIVLREENLVDSDQASRLVHARQALRSSDAGYEPPLLIADETAVRRLLNLDVPEPAQIAGDKSVNSRDTGRAVGEAATKLGLDVLFGPTLNVPPDKKNKYEEPSLFGADQEAVAALGLSYADGLRDGGVIPVVREYPAMNKHGDKLDVSRSRLAELMYPFAEAASKNVPGILVSHVAVPLLDKQEPDRPACLSPVLVRRVLRELDDWKYSGVVIADDISACGIPPEDAAVQALAAGCDAVICLDPAPEKLAAIESAIDQAINDGRLDRAELVKSTKRLNEWVEKLGHRITIEQLAEEPQQPEPPKPEAHQTEPPNEETQNTAEANPAEIPAASTPPAPPSTIGPEPTEPTPQMPAEATEVSAPESAPVPETPVPVPQETAPAPQKPTAVPQPPDTEKVLHEVVPGDTLLRIANQYMVDPKDIVAWNAMKDMKVRYGTKLVIYRKKTGDLSKTEATKPETQKPGSTSSTAKSASMDTQKYVVQEGDTARRIAARFGITLQKLAELNKISDLNHVEIGQELIIPKQ